MPELRLTPPSASAPASPPAEAGTPAQAASALSMLSDEELMSLALGGRQDAYGALVRRHEGRVRRYIARMCGAAEAEDLAQETFISLWKARERYRETGRFTVLLYRIARHRALSHLRWRKVRTLFKHRVENHEVADPFARPSNPGALARVLRTEEDATLNAVLSTLPVDLRETLALRFGEELDYRTIAAVTGVAEGSARSRAHRGLALLRARLAERKEPT